MSNHSLRRDRLRRIIKKHRLDGMLVTHEINVTYLTGFTGDSSYLLITPKHEVLLSDTRYEEQIGEECPGLDVDIRDSSLLMHQLIGRQLGSVESIALAVEGDALSKNEFDQLDERLPMATLVPQSGWVESLREVKDKGEIQAIRESIYVAERAFAVIRASLRGDQTELEVAHNLEHQIRLFGGTECAFDPIVGVGPRAALPHGIPSPRRIESDPFVLIDWGARVNGYMSDLTRILVTGRISPKLERIYGLVLNAQLAAIDKIRPGIRASEVDRAARQVISQGGHGKHFGHGLGHGFGLEIHESPRMSPINDKPLKAGMVVTVEPGIYLPGWGGVRIEDDVLVTKEGHEVLTTVTKDLSECVVD